MILYLLVNSDQILNTYVMFIDVNKMDGWKM